MKYLKAALVAITALLVGLVMAGPASAGGSPHFIKNATTATIVGQGDLQVSFKEAGLAAGAIENITVSADFAITYECVNGGNHNPAASNKHTSTGSASTSDNFPADKNGNVVGSETLKAKTASELGFSCPSGQTVTLVSVVWSNVVVTDNTSLATITLKGTFSYINPDAPPVRG